MTVRNIIIFLAGMYTLAGAIFDWEWFIGNRKAAIFVQLLGRNGARIFYGLLGIGLIGLGIYFFLNPQVG